MKSIKKALLMVVMICSVAVLNAPSASAQCAMCSATVESGTAGGSHKTAGLNNGIIYLLAAPYIAVAVVAYIWYKKYRRKNVNLQMRNDKLHLN